MRWVRPGEGGQEVLGGHFGESKGFSTPMVIAP